MKYPHAAILVAAALIGFDHAPALGQSDALIDRSDPSWASDFGGQRIFTQPSQDAVLAFSFPTQIAEILVAGGDIVTKGQLLARAKDVRILVEVQFERIRAESRLDVDLADAELDIAQINFDAVTEVRAQDAGSKAEFLQRENQLKQAKIRLDMAEISHKQRQSLLAQKLAELDNYHLTAPFDGQIESVGMDVGNSANDGEPVVRVVQINPLRLDVPTPIEQTIGQGLKVGGDAWVLLDIPGQPQVIKGKISEISPVADFASQKQRVRVEVANDQHWPAGLTAWVRFTEPGQRWLKLTPQTSAKAGEPAQLADRGIAQ